MKTVVFAFLLITLIADDLCGTYVVSCSSPPEKNDVYSVAEITLENTADDTNIVAIRKIESFYSSNQCSGNPMFRVESHYTTAYIGEGDKRYSYNSTLDFQQIFFVSDTALESMSCNRDMIKTNVYIDLGYSSLEYYCTNFYADAFREGSYTDVVEITYDSKKKVISLPTLERDVVYTATQHSILGCSSVTVAQSYTGWLIFIIIVLIIVIAVILYWKRNYKYVAITQRKKVSPNP